MLIGDIINKQDAHCTTVVSCGDGAETLLAGLDQRIRIARVAEERSKTTYRVPNLQLNSFSFKLNGFDFEINSANFRKENQVFAEMRRNTGSGLPNRCDETGCE